MQWTDLRLQLTVGGRCVRSDSQPSKWQVSASTQENVPINDQVCANHFGVPGSAGGALCVTACTIWCDTIREREMVYLCALQCWQKGQLNPEHDIKNGKMKKKLRTKNKKETKNKNKLKKQQQHLTYSLTYLACWFILPLSPSFSKVKVVLGS